MYQISLFTGAMGGDLGTVHLLGWRPVLYCEYDGYCQRIVQQRIKDGVMPDAPIWGDIRTLGGRVLRPYRRLAEKHSVVVTAGFPCQPFSVAGKQQAEKDERNMWPDTIRVIREVRPRYCFLENVPNLLAGSHGYFGRILRDLAESGYNVRWCVLSAAAVGAPHLRKRLWILAQSGSFRWGRGCHGNAEGMERTLQTAGPSSRDQQACMADAESEQGGWLPQRELQPDVTECGRWGNQWWRNDPADLPDSCQTGLEGAKFCGDDDQEIIGRQEGSTRAIAKRNSDVGGKGAAQPQMGRVAHGVPDRVKRLKALGNGQVPLVAATAWKILSEGFA